MPPYLTLADTAWLHLEQPHNLMMISGLLMLDRNPDRERLEIILTERLLCFDRFRMLVVEPHLGVGLPHWEFDPQFQLARHLGVESLDAGDEGTLMLRVGELMSEPLPRDRPLWDLRVFEDLENGAAVLVRLHHAIADGIALVRVLLNLACPHPEHEIEPSVPEVTPGGRGTEPSTLGKNWKRTTKAANQLLKAGHQLLFHPSEAVALLSGSVQAGKALGRVLTLPEDRPNVLRGSLSVKKVAAVSQPLSVEALKVKGKRLGCTVNDLLMAVLAGAFGRHLARSQAVEPDLEIRAVVPVDLRGGQVKELGNKFGLVFLPLPVGEPDPLRRLDRVHQAMQNLKNSAEAFITFELLSAAGILPVQLEQTLIEWFGNKATAVVTNLHGPDQPIYLGAAKLTGLMFWVPQSGQLGVGVSMISYAGELRVGVASDSGLMPEPGLFVADFQQAYDELLDGQDR